MLKRLRAAIGDWCWRRVFVRGTADAKGSRADDSAANRLQRARRKSGPYMRGTCPHCGEISVKLRRDGEPNERYHPFCNSVPRSGSGEAA